MSSAAGLTSYKRKKSLKKVTKPKEKEKVKKNPKRACLQTGAFVSTSQRHTSHTHPGVFIADSVFLRRRQATQTQIQPVLV